MPGVLTPAGRRILAVAALAVTAALPAAGCSASQPAAGATVASCYAFAVQALDQHVTVTSVPTACAGLTHEQINLAVDRAIRTVVGPHRKVVARRLTHKEAAYLSYLVTVVPPRVHAAPAATPARPSSRLPLDLGALAAWVVTAAAGTWLLAGWIAGGGLRRGSVRVAGVPRAVIVSHFTLAVTGLGIWIAFLVTGTTALAWVAVAVVLSVAGLGMATLAGGLPEQRQPTGSTAEQQPAMPGLPAATGSPGTRPASAAGPAPASTAGPAPVSTVRPAPGGTEDPAPPDAGEATGTRRPAERIAAIAVPAGGPVARIVLHGALAAATILLVVLAAIGTG